MTTQSSNEHWQPDPELIASALEIVRPVLDLPHTPDRLAQYYATESNYAGGTFSGLGDMAPFEVTAADLLAVTTLSVDIPPMAVRRFLECPQRARLSHLLRELPPESRLNAGTTETLAPAMAALYLQIKGDLRRHGPKSSNPWVTASKICARKRPDLFPVRDNVVRKLLRLDGGYHKDWPVFAALISDPAISGRLDELAKQTRERRGVGMGRDGALRILDVALWMEGISR